MRYTVMVRSTRFRSIPERPVRSFPFKWFAEFVAKGANLNEEEESGGVLEFYVSDSKDPNNGRVEEL